jgi:hypothetical protein
LINGYSRGNNEKEEVSTIVKLPDRRKIGKPKLISWSKEKPMKRLS